MIKRLGLGLVPAILFLMLAIFFWRGLSLDPHTLPSARLGQKLPAFNLPDLVGNQLFSNELFNHQPVVLHVWASWCTTCAEEQVFLLKLARMGIPLYGINYKDDAALAQNWLARRGNPYRQILADTQGRFAIDLGVYGTPETFLVDKDGIIQFRHVGALNQKVWDDVLKPKWEAMV